MDALHVCIDGNFHFHLKPKHTDPKDFPLTKGAAYFAHEDDFKLYIDMTKPYPMEVCSMFMYNKHNSGTHHHAQPATCNKFKANSRRYKGPVSGIIALVCRHNFVLAGSIVDLTKGEK